MMEENINENYRHWMERVSEPELKKELCELAHDPVRLENAFCRDLRFGTGGLRGLLGAGTNRMNVYTVGKASQGLADYIRKHFPVEKRHIAVSYDSRINSRLFAETAAGIFAANSLQVHLYPRLMPTPCLSFAVRELGCAAGVMITASHNPANYNGYKVYGPDGCQITTAAAAEITAEIEKLDPFADVRREEFSEALGRGAVEYIPETVLTAFIEAVKKQSVLGDAPAKKEIAVVYSPLNGTGLEPVMRTLREAGYTNLTLVEEQKEPDGRFPTCPVPNPELEEALVLGLKTARCENAALLLATDPDCDRVGVVARDEKGEYVRLSGNQVGLLLLDYLCARRTAAGTMPPEPVLLKTIVTTVLAERIAEAYGLRTVNVLTGFKYIGEQIGLLEAEGRLESFVFGFEESCGYLSGGYVRDKDGVGAALLICEMAAYYAAQGQTLPERLEELYRIHGRREDRLISYAFEGPDGLAEMGQIMSRLRGPVKELGGIPVVSRLDYAEGLGGLPKSDVLQFILADGTTVTLRPSGTEPKLKVYVLTP